MDANGEPMWKRACRKACAKETVLHECDKYAISSLANDDVDILKWWGDNANMYPILANMARDFLAIPATSAPAERVFSQGRRLISYYRHKLSARTIEMVMSLKYWYMAELDNVSEQFNEDEDEWNIDDLLEEEEAVADDICG